MSWILLVTGVTALSLPAVGQRLFARMVPHQAVRVNFAALILGLVSVICGLVVTASTWLLSSSAHSVELLNHLSPGARAAGPLAIALLVIAAFVISRALFAGWRGRRASLALRKLGYVSTVDGQPVLVLPTQRLTAFAMPRTDTPIVVTTSLTELLGDEELKAVVRHERAHLQHKHHRHLLTASLVDACFASFVPTIRRSTDNFRSSLERLADHEATTDSVSRSHVVSALRRLSSSSESSRSDLKLRVELLTSDLPLHHSRTFRWLPYALLPSLGLSVGLPAGDAFIHLTPSLASALLV